jgi:hypothetical protein
MAAPHPQQYKCRLGTHTWSTSAAGAAVQGHARRAQTHVLLRPIFWHSARKLAHAIGHDCRHGTRISFVHGSDECEAQECLVCRLTWVSFGRVRPHLGEPFVAASLWPAWSTTDNQAGQGNATQRGRCQQPGRPTACGAPSLKRALVVSFGYRREQVNK